MKGTTRVICLLWLLGIAAAAHKPSPDEAALEHILQHMDDSANPCDDFQRFSSGRFLDVHKADGIYSLHGLVKDRFNARMQKVFDRLKYRVLADEASVEEKVWLFYKTCLTAPKETHSWKHYIQLVPPATGLTWPQFAPRGSQWPEEKFDWLETLARLRRFGLETLLIGMVVEPRTDDTTKFRVIVGKQHIDTIEKESRTKHLLITLGVSRKRAGILARDIMVLEREIKQLAEVSGGPNHLSIGEFENRTKLALGKFLGTAFGSSFDSGFAVEAYEMDYLEGLDGLLAKFDAETVASYLMVGFVRHLKVLDGAGGQGDPAECAAAVAVHMQPAAELLYKNFYFRLGKLQRNIDEVQRLFELISSSFLGRLQSNRFNLTAEEVQHLTQRLSTMTVTVGKLPNLENQRRYVIDFYSNLNLESAELDFAELHLKVLEHRNRKGLEQLDGPVPKGKGFFLLANDRNAYAEPELHQCNNTVVLPIDILQAPFFAPEMHDVFKVSLLGFMLARQILRNFLPYHLSKDVEGANGLMLEDFAQNPGYVEAIACLKATQDSESIDDRVLDVMALRLVYRTYFGDDSKFSQDQPSFSKLPLRQLFLLNFAQIFVGDAEQLIYGDTTDPDKLRLSQAVSQLQSFGNAFNCPTTEALNPPVKCEIW